MMIMIRMTDEWEDGLRSKVHLHTAGLCPPRRSSNLEQKKEEADRKQHKEGLNE